VNLWRGEVQAGLNVLRHSEILHTNAGLRSAHYTGERGHWAGCGVDRTPCEQGKIGSLCDGEMGSRGVKGVKGLVRAKEYRRLPRKISSSVAVASRDSAYLLSVSRGQLSSIQRWRAAGR
jgi:hypothetical protein